MRVMVHANAPWVGTGYGQQCRLIAPRLQRAGHQVAISAVYGFAGAQTAWNGIPIYPVGFVHYGGDVVAGHARDFGADLVLTLLDVWAMDTTGLIEAEVAMAHWLPVDTTPLSVLDRYALERGGDPIPVAMSRHGQRALEDAGFSALYAPHAIDCGVFQPGDKAAARGQMGIPEDAFVIGINAANKDPVRKGFPEQFAAFARLHERHPDTLLLVHSTPTAAGSEGVDLGALAADLGIAGAVRWSDTWKYVTGGYNQADLAVWYSALDLYSGCSYAEGFGLPIAEAQACGVPVVVTDCSAMSELCGAGWKVPGQPYWNPGHRAWWTVPFASEIEAAYQEAYDGKAAVLARGAREFALGYDAGRVFTEHWEPVLEEIGKRVGA